MHVVISSAVSANCAIKQKQLNSVSLARGLNPQITSCLQDPHYVVLFTEMGDEGSTHFLLRTLLPVQTDMTCIANDHTR